MTVAVILGALVVGKGLAPFVAELSWEESVSTRGKGAGPTDWFAIHARRRRTPPVSGLEAGKSRRRRMTEGLKG